MLPMRTGWLPDTSSKSSGGVAQRTQRHHFSAAYIEQDGRSWQGRGVAMRAPAQSKRLAGAMRAAGGLAILQTMTAAASQGRSDRREAPARAVGRRIVEARRKDAEGDDGR